MMRLNNQADIKIVENEILSNLEKYETLIHEFNQSGYNDKPAILLYYSPATFSNAFNYFKKNNSSNPIADALKYCLPFMQRAMEEVRLNMNNNENGVVTVMLREAAMLASEDPTQLISFEVEFLNKNEALIKKIK